MMIKKGTMMKKLVIAALLVTTSLTSFAQGHGGHHGGGHGGPNMLIPLVVGGVVGYAMGSQRPQYQPQPQVVYQYNPYVNSVGGEYCQNQYFTDQNGVYHTVRTCTR